jgi:3-hydroxybutyryl-CoA dehydratase
VILKIGDKFIKDFIISDKMITGFSIVTGDHNPVHLDDEFAKNSIFKKRIAHGMLVGSLISSVIGNYFPGIGTIYLSQTMKFLNPVFINDSISVHIEVIEIMRNNWIKLKTNCYNQDNIWVINGHAVVIPPNSSVT